MSEQQLLSTVLNEFEDSLNDAHGDIVIAGMNFQASRLLKATDPAAYRAQFDEWNHFIRPAGEVDTDELVFDVDFPG